MPTREQIEAAAGWWAERLTNCRNSGLSAQERMQPENTSYQFAEMLMQAGRPQVSDEQVERFRLALVDGLLSAKPYEAYGLHVDYGCDKLLSDALAAADIPDRTGTLPIKTNMWLNDNGTVAVRYGYGAEIETIYTPATAVDAVDPSAVIQER